MKITAQLMVNDKFLLDLFDLYVDKSEVKEIQDAIDCEMKYNDFDIEF